MDDLQEREEKEKRKSDRRDSWADKQVLKGKYANAAEAKKRFVNIFRA